MIRETIRAAFIESSSKVRGSGHNAGAAVRSGVGKSAVVAGKGIGYALGAVVIGAGAVHGVLGGFVQGFRAAKTVEDKRDAHVYVVREA